MTNKPPIALGVVMALAMAGGQAVASGCPTEISVGSIEGQTDFSCTLPGKTLDDFNFNRNVGQSQMLAITSSGSVDTITLSVPDGTALQPGTELNYTIAATGTNSIVRGAAGNVAPSGVSGTLQVTRMNQFTVEIPRNGNATLFSEPNHTFNTVDVANRITEIGVTSLFNSFTQSSRPSGVPEPMSLSLFSLGLGGLAFVRRRRS